VIFASGFEVSSELSRRWGIEVVEGRNKLSIYDHWADGYRTFHGMMTHGFPNQFFVQFTQGGFNANVTATFDQQAITSRSSSTRRCAAGLRPSSARRKPKTSGSKPCARRATT
jgi:hypothetical protein